MRAPEVLLFHSTAHFSLVFRLLPASDFWGTFPAVFRAVASRNEQRVAAGTVFCSRSAQKISFQNGIQRKDRIAEIRAQQRKGDVLYTGTATSFIKHQAFIVVFIIILAFVAYQTSGLCQLTRRHLRYFHTSSSSLHEFLVNYRTFPHFIASLPVNRNESILFYSVLLVSGKRTSRSSKNGHQEVRIPEFWMSAKPVVS